MGKQKIKSFEINKVVLKFKNIKKGIKKTQGGLFLYDGDVYLNNKKIHRQIIYAKNLDELKFQLFKSYKIRTEFK